MKKGLKFLVMILILSISLLSMKAIALNTFDDDSSINEDYKNAVYDMVDAGILTGIEDTVFDPQGLLSREQAAIIVSRIILGAEDVSALTAETDPFNDVTTERWSAGAIEYCANNGIISGVGNGAFKPADDLSGYAFVKMLLCVLGYDETERGYTGDSWATNVTTDAENAGITDSTITISAEAIPREEAAYLANNAYLLFINTIENIEETGDTEEIEETADRKDISEGNISLWEEGDYIISGRTDENIIRVWGEGNYNIILDGIDIESSSKYPIYVYNEDAKVNLILTEGTENNIISEETAIYSIGDLTISGAGNLSVESEETGIRCNECELTIDTTGKIYINSEYSGISCSKENISMAEGLVEITTHADGINCTTEYISYIAGTGFVTNSSKGNVEISGGTLKVSAMNTGVHAHVVEISGQSAIDISVISSDADNLTGISAEYLNMSDGIVNIKATKEDSEDADHYTTGISSTNLNLTGGELSIDLSGVRYTRGISSSNVLISNSSKLSIVLQNQYAGDAIGLDASSESSSISIEGGTVDITVTYGAKSHKYSSDINVIDCYRDVEIIDGTVNLTVSGNPDSAVEANGIYTRLGEIKITGGCVTVSATKYALVSNISLEHITINKKLSIYAGEDADTANEVSEYNSEAYVCICS